MKYVDQSARDLRLSLLTSDVDMNQFDILKSGSIHHHGIVIKAGIIGASHFLSIYKGDFQFHEVFACVGVEDGEKIVHYGPFESFKKGGVDLGLEGFDYSFKACIHDWDEVSNHVVAIESKIELLASSENTIGLSFEFPGEQSSKVAKTLVLVEFYPGPTNGINQLEIKTVHSYPNDEDIVITKGFLNL